MGLSRGREMGSLLMHASISITHAFFFLWFVVFSFFSLFFFLVLPLVLPMMIIPLFLMIPTVRSYHPLYCLSYVIYHFYPLTAFGPLWVSFQDCLLACRLPNHYHCTECVGCATPHSQTKMACLVSCLPLFSLLSYG